MKMGDKYDTFNKLDEFLKPYYDNSYENILDLGYLINIR